MDKMMNIILNIKDKPEVKEATKEIKNFSIKEQEQFSFLIKGIKLGMALKEDDEEKSA